MLVAVRVDKVTLDTSTNRFVVILKDDVQDRWLPIVVGSTEAQAIALQLERISPPRPLTHDLMKNLLESINIRVARIVVSDLRENTYYAVIGLKNNGTTREIDARPSDAIALALRMKAPIFVDEDVMKKASVSDKTMDVPEPDSDDLSGLNEIEKLNVLLQRAVEEERFEDAAKIRDEISSLKRQYEEESE